MSRRYGRNQKRRARAEAEALHHLIDESSRLIMRLNGDACRLHEALAIAREVLGPDHPAFEPSKIERFNGEERLRMPIYQRAPAAAVQSSFNSASILQSWQYVDVLTTDLMRDEFRRETHFRFEFDDISWGYGISEAALRKTAPSVTARNIAREIAPLIMQTFAEKGRAPRMK